MKRSLVFLLLAVTAVQAQTVNPGRVNVVTTPWSVNWLTHNADGPALTDLGFSAVFQTWIGAADANHFRPSLQMGWINVKDHPYHAAGDGVTNDTAAIQAALTTADPCSTIYFPPGTYLCTGTLTVADINGLTLRGTLGSCIRNSDKTKHIFTVQDCNDLTFDGLRLYGASTGNDAQAGIQVLDGGTTQRLTVRNCEIGFTNKGVANANPNLAGFVVTECYFHDIPGTTSGHGYGVYTCGSNGQVLGNRFINVARHSMYWSSYNAALGCMNNLFAHNYVRGGGAEAVAFSASAAMSPCRGNRAEHNVFVDVEYAAGFDQNVLNCSFSYNTIDTCSSYAVRFNGGTSANEYPKFCQVMGNQIRNCSGTNGAIRVENASYNLILGNVLNSPGSYGILLTTSGTPSEAITGNSVTDNVITGAGIEDLSLGPTLTNTVALNNRYATGSLLAHVDYLQPAGGYWLANGLVVRDVNSIETADRHYLRPHGVTTYYPTVNSDPNLADGTHQGQTVSIIRRGGTGTLTVKVAHHLGGTPKTFTFVNPGDAIELVWDYNVWITKSYVGITP